jgi:poly(A) polymerase
MIIPQDKGWQAAGRIVARLADHGFRAILAGGCVRDMLLDRQPKDYDVATNATPTQVLDLFPKGRKVGAKFGVVLVQQLGQDVEVATFRREGAYSDGRHPDEVVFGTEQDDAQRRDFTINGMFLDPRTSGVIDYVGGRADIETRVLRTIGNAHDRFAEDHLRMLRAVRLAARLGFSIDEQTAAAIKELAHELAKISAERIWMELEQILTHPSRATGWRLLNELELREKLSNEWKPDGKFAEVVMRRVAALPQAPVSDRLGLAAAILLEDRKQVEPICRSLKLSNDLTEDVVWLKEYLGQARDPKDLELADVKLLMANPNWPDLLELLRADLVAWKSRPDGLRSHDELKRRAASIRLEDVAPPPLLTGDDLTEMGYQPGPEFGRVLNAVYRAQLNERIVSKDQAAAMARELFAP